MKRLNFATETAMLDFGRHFATQLVRYFTNGETPPIVIYLNGELGAGKTTFTRSIVNTFGHHGNVKSPTYTLVEEYVLPQTTIYHFDLYRLADPEELEFMGIRDYFRPNTLSLLEWANRGEGMIPAADIIIYIDYAAQGRAMSLTAQNAVGKRILQMLG